MTPIRPWQVWWVEDQAGRRPAIVVSSRTHLDLVAGALITVVPLTTRERPGWTQRVPVRFGGRVSYAITEQVRTVAARRLVGERPLGTLRQDDIDEVRTVLRWMVDW